MSGNLIDLRRRIKSVKNTRKITQAMKTVSAAKLRRSLSELNRNRPLLAKIESLLSRVGREVKMESHPFLKKREKGEWVIVAVSSDKGLCGAFNSHVVKRTEDYYHRLAEQGESISLVTVGNKIHRHLKKRQYPIKKHYPSMMARLKYEDARQLSVFLREIYENEDIKRVEFVYTEFISSAKQELGLKALFPLKDQWAGAEQGEGEGEKHRQELEYIFEPSAEEIFKKLLPQYINTLVYRLLLESSASEHAARMIAMDLATRNAGDMIRWLTLTMNKLRQASITKELLEIITATEALKK